MNMWSVRWCVVAATATCFLANAHVAFAADVTPPTDPVPSIASGTALALNDADDMSVEWTAATDAESGVANYEYCIGTGGMCDIVGWTLVGPAVTSLTASGLALVEGNQYQVCVRAYDGAGNMSGGPCTAHKILDTTAPSAPLIVNDLAAGVAGDVDLINRVYAGVSHAPDATGIAALRACTGTVAFACDIDALVTTSSASAAYFASTKVANNQQFFVCVWAIDGAGNTSPGGTCTDGAVYDAVAPNAALVPLISTQYLASSEVTARVVPGDAVYMDIRGVTYEAASISAITTLKKKGPKSSPWVPVELGLRFMMNSGDRSYVVWTRFKDAAGNISNWEQFTWVLDSKSPEVELEVLSQDLWNAGDEAKLSWEAYDDGSGVETQSLTVDGVAVSSEDGIASTQALAAGTHTVEAIAVDKAGHRTSKSTTFEVAEATATTPVETGEVPVEEAPAAPVETDSETSDSTASEAEEPLAALTSHEDTTTENTTEPAPTTKPAGGIVNKLIVAPAEKVGQLLAANVPVVQMPFGVLLLLPITGIGIVGLRRWLHAPFDFYDSTWADSSNVITDP